VNILKKSKKLSNASGEIKNYFDNEAEEVNYSTTATPIDCQKSYTDGTKDKRMNLEYVVSHQVR